MEITQEQIDNAIENCILRNVVFNGVYICRGEVAPCFNVIDSGKCDVLKELFRGEANE